MASNPSIQTSRIIYADALRLIAILFVVVNHMSLATNITFGGRSHNFSWLGIWGVDCFFVLTGYLLSQSFFLAILGKKPFPSARSFFARRFLRIYPLYLFALVASIVVDFLTHDAPTFGDMVSHVFLVHSLFPQYISQINGPFWTMSIDAQFYLALPLFAFALYVVTKPMESTEARSRVIWISLFAIAGASVLERLGVLWHSSFPDWEHVSVVSRNLPGMASNFAIGSAISFLEIRKPLPLRPKSWYLASMALGVLLIAVLARLPLQSQSHFVLVTVNTLSDFIGGCSAGALLYGALRGEFTGLTRLLDSKVVVRGAALAYAIYLFHYPIIFNAVALYGRPLSKPLVAFGFSIVLLVPILLVALAAHEFIERPGLQMRDRHREPVPTLP